MFDCASCEHHACRDGVDCFDAVDRVRELYQEADEATMKLVRTAARIESEGYMQWPRALEIIRFARAAAFQHVGVVFCIGLAVEAGTFAELLETSGFQVSSVCCKACGIDKDELNLPQLDPKAERETMCSPLGQAALLEEAGTEINVVIGLCVGHDMLFSQRSAAPVTTLVAKDRVLAHNPAGALYSGYWKRKLQSEQHSNRGSHPDRH
ncbi:DUF1847 domain-containing protein [Planctomycetota bacterium]